MVLKSISSFINEIVCSLLGNSKFVSGLMLRKRNEMEGEGVNGNCNVSPIVRV